MFQSIRKQFTKWAGAAVLCGLCTPSPALAQEIINTRVGDGAAVYSGDGGAATAAGLNYPKGLAIDGAGNVYIADTENFRVRRVSSAGIITTFAGNGNNTFAGDNGPAANASISDADSVAVDSSGNVYIADSSNRVIRKVTPSGTITTIAGTGGVQGFSGDNGPAANALLGRPVSLAFDAAGNLYFADSVNQRVRKISANGTITTVAGNGTGGFTGDNGPASAAELDFPIAVAVDAAGNVYVADGNNNRVRKISTGGIISTVVGNGNGTFAGDGGSALNASINIPSDLAFDTAGNMYIADAGNNRVRMVNTSGNISTVAGIGENGYSGDGGPATSAMLNYPWGLMVDYSGNVYIADRVNCRVRTIASGQAQTAPPSFSDYPAVNGASFAVGMAPGGIVTLFGSNFSSGTAQYQTVPLPVNLAGTTVTFNGEMAPLFYVSPQQINVQAPFDLTIGQVQVEVHRGDGATVSAFSSSAAFSPGIFVINQQNNQGAIVHTSNFSLVSGTAPAQGGEVIAMYVTGLGATTVPVASGAIAPSVPPFAQTVTNPTVTIGGANAQVLYSGLAPGFVGLYQINVIVPPSVPSGNQTVQISMGGNVSNSVTLAVNQ